MTTYTVYGRTYSSPAELAARLAEIDQAHPGGRYPQAIADEVEGLRATLGDIDAEQRLERIRSLAQDPRNREAGTDFGSARGGGGGRAAGPDVGGPGGELR